MSILIGNRPVNQAQLRGNIQKAADSVMQAQGMVDYFELLADGYMSLDNTASDENRKKNAVSIVKDDLLVNAERAKDGTLKSFEIIDETGDEPQEIRKTMTEGRATYEVSFGGQNMIISEDVNGTLVFEAG